LAEKTDSPLQQDSISPVELSLNQDKLMLTMEERSGSSESGGAFPSMLGLKFDHRGTLSWKRKANPNRPPTRDKQQSMLQELMVC
jgi:hypothetical protein